MSKNASSLIVQSSRTLHQNLPLLPINQPSCLLPLASCLTQPTNGLFQQPLSGY